MYSIDKIIKLLMKQEIYLFDLQFAGIVFNLK